MASRKPIVWVIKEQVRRGVTGPEPMDYTPAMRYGDIEFITQYDLPLHPNGSLAANWWQAVKDFTHSFDPKQDFIVATGQPMAMVLIGYVLGVMRVEPTFLVWRREENKYIPYTPAVINEIVGATHV